MVPELRLVSAVQQVRQSLISFNAEASSYSARALSLLRQTTYFVYDPETGCFGPAKYVGFAGMSFEKYEQALKQQYTGGPFDGFATWTAIESTFRTSFVSDDRLRSKLIVWAESVFGPGVFEGTDEKKWAFVEASGTRNYWALVAHPEMYDIQGAISELTEDEWLVHRSQVSAGDRVAIWKAKGRGTYRGIIALGEVLTAPTMMLPRPQNKKYYLDPKLMTTQRRVIVKYVLPPRLPFWLETDKSGVLGSLSVARATGGTVFKISPDEWHRVVTVLGGWPIPQGSPAGAAVQAAEALRMAGQGFQSDSAVRKAVEEHAMQHAERHLIKQGYSVIRVGKPYDLRCSKGSSVLYVEVKGTQTEATEILLTPNEVLFANSHRNEMALFVLHNIVVSHNGGQILTTAGTIRFEPKWLIDLSKLSPLKYTYTLPET